MARTTIVFAALFLVAGLIAALLPAQEAAWKKTAAPKNVQPLEPRPLSRDQRDEAYPIVPAAGEGAASARLSDDIGPIPAEEAQSAGDATNAPADEAAPSKAREMMSILKRQRSQPA